MTERAENLIRDIIERRLQLGGGECLINVRKVAKAAMHELGLEDSRDRRVKRRIMCQAVLQVLQEYNIELWDLIKRKMQDRDDDEVPLSRRIYSVREKK